MTTHSLDLDTLPGYRYAVAVLRSAAAAYYSGAAAAMDDASYDALMRAVTHAEHAHPDWVDADGPVSGQVAAGAVTGDVVHAAPSLSLGNAFSLDDLTAFGEQAARLAGGVPGGWVIEPKLDGLACLLTIRDGRIERLATRGDGTAGEDVTAALAFIGGLPPHFPPGTFAEIRGEVVMTHDELQRANVAREAAGKPAYSNCRNAAAGALRAKENTVPVQLEFYAYGAADLPGHDRFAGADHSALVATVQEWGVRTASSALAALDGQAGMTIHAADIASAHARIIDLAGRRDVLPFDIDGFVVKADSAQVRSACGATSHSPRWAIAYKLPAEMRMTRLLDIEVQVGRTGRITPVAVLDPVEVGNVTVASATLNNFGHIARLDVRIGDTVWVRRAGEVIPEIVAVEMPLRPADTTPFEAPATCPRCHGTLDTSEQVWRCTLGRDCGRAEAIEWWASRDCMDVDGLGPAAVAALMQAGMVTDIADLYHLDVDAVAQLDGFGHASAAALIAQLDAARTRPLGKFIAALGIPKMGRRLAARLADRFGTLDAVRAATVDDLAEVDGIGAIKAQALHDGLRACGPLIDALLAAGVTPPAQQTAAPAGDGPLSGMKVCVTGSIPGLTRQQAEARVVALGGASVSSVSKATSLLVAGEAAGSKLAKARQLGIQVWTAEQFLAAG